MTSSHQNAATVLDMLDAIWNRGHLSVLDTSVAEDHVDHDADGDEIGRDLLARGIQVYLVASRTCACPSMSRSPTATGS
jgi:hypothetical protein